VNGGPALVAWALAASLIGMRERRRVVRAARARHEVRGPLCTALLALDGLEPSARVAAIGMELRRAALALDDLVAPRRRSTPLAAVVGPRRPTAARGAARATVDVGRLLADVAPAWRALADAHGTDLEVEPGRAVVTGDPLRLAQACANLVTNAIEHGGGGVRVTSSAVDEGVRIEVTDLGPGLPAPLPKLVAAGRGRRSARGHGLAIAAAIAERHGGRLITIPAPRGAGLALELPEASTGPPGHAAARPRSEAGAVTHRMRAP
jgi:signal transduction histidine kinase